jgi:hypothetical protein
MGQLRSGKRVLIYTCLGDAPTMETIRKNPAVQALLPEIGSVRNVGNDHLVFSEDRFWLHATFGVHTAEIFGDLSDPDEGGILRIRYHESGYLGSRLRMEMIGVFLRELGMSVQIEEDSDMTAVLDKDHGLDSPDRISENIGFILKFLHDTADMDLMFGALMDSSEDEVSLKIARRLGKLYFERGAWPFPNDDAEELTSGLERLDDLSGEEASVREKLDAELARLRLPPIPAEAGIGQMTVDRYFTRPIEEAAARGDLLFQNGGRPEPAEARPLEDLAEAALLSPKESAAAASLAGGLDFRPIGFVGALRAERAQRRLVDGSILTVHALRDTASGTLAYAVFSVWGGEGRPDLKALLEREGMEVGDGEPWSEAQEERLALLLRRPVSGESQASTLGLPASPGIGAGPVTFDRANSRKGAILAVPFTSPDDLEAISRSAGVITTGGGALSHAAITTRELGLPSVILPSARWRKDGLELNLTRLGPARELPGGLQAAGLEPVENPALKEGDLVRIDGKSGVVVLSDRAGQAAPEEAPKAEAPAQGLPAPKPLEMDQARAEEIRRRRPSMLRLEEVDSSLTGFVGGKAAKLGEMTAAVPGRVPGGIALTHWAFERFLEENKIKEPGRDAILAGRLDPDKGVGREILDALRASEGSRWAVRSSAVQEDGDDAAFAGAAESYLFVKPGEILAKVVENWASFWLPRGILYRQQHGLDSSSILPATLIQEMVPAEKSGVVFTRNPVSSADEIVINAVYGLGEGAVSGQAEADSYTTRKSDGEEVELPHVARKRWQVLEAGLAPVPKPLRGRRVLTPEQTRELSALAVSIENHFGRPMDIEFSIHEGKIFILQARPITTP